MRIVLIALLVLATTSAWAEWIKLSEDDGAIHYIDPATIRRDGNLRRAWELQDRKSPAPGGVLSYRVLKESDCTEERDRVLSISGHSGPMATGKVLFSVSHASDSWTYQPPNSVGAALLKRVCEAMPESTLAQPVRPSDAPISRSKSGSTSSSTIAIPLEKQGGTLVVPVLINNAITLNFIVDSGATDVSIPSDVVKTLMRTGTLKQADFLGKKTYVLADGSKVPSETFRIRSMKVGDRVVENVIGSVANTDGVLLLGQSFLGRFKSWSIDNGKQALLLE